MATVTIQRIDVVEPLGQQSSYFGPITKNLYLADSLGRMTVDTRDAPYFIASFGFSYWQPGSGGGTSPTSGVTTLQFGAFPGAPQASVTVSAIDAADPNAEIDAWIIPIATTDHSADEHVYDPPRLGCAIVGTSIVITGFPSGRDLYVPASTPFGNTANSQMPVGNTQCMPYGAWSVAWAFSP